MNKVPKDRADKINFLKKLMKGQTTIKEIMPIKYKVWFIENGYRINKITGEKLNNVQWQARHPNGKGVITVKLNI